MGKRQKTRKELEDEIRRLKQRLVELEHLSKHDRQKEIHHFERAEQLQAVVEGSHAGILIIGENFRIIEVNQQACTILGFSRKEIINSDFRKYIAPEYLDLITSRYQKRIRREKVPSRYEFDIIRKDGMHRRVEVSAIIITDSDNKFQTIAQILDITDKNRTRARLKEEEEKYRETVNHIPLALLTLNDRGIITSVNPAFERILDIPSENVVDKLKITDLPLFFDTPLINSFRNLITRQKRFDLESPLLTLPSGKQIYLRCRGIPLNSSKSDSFQYLVLLGDITDRKQAEQSLRYRVGFERVITTLSADFVRLGPEEVDEGINRALKIIGKFTGVDRSYVFLFRENGTIVDNTHEWCAEGIEPQKDHLQGLSVDLFPWWMKKLKQFEFIHIPFVSELPPEAGAEKELLKAQDIQSLIALPMIVRDSLIGFLGFDSVRKERSWSKETVELLKIISGLFANALDRKWAEEALRESEQRFRNLIENSPMPLLIHSQGKAVFVNPAMVKLMGGKSEEELLGSRVINWVHPDYREIVRKRIRQVYKEGKTADTLEEKLIRRDGRVIHVEAKATPITYQGKPASQTVFTDITQRKRTEEALRESEQRYRLLFDLLPYGGEVLDTKGYIINCSPSTARMLGYELDELIGKHITQFLHPDSRKVFKDKFHLLVKGNRAEAEVYMIRKDGSKLAVLRAAQPIINDRGKVTGILALSVDISDRKQAETIRQIMYNISNAVNTTRSTTDLYQVIEKELSKILNTKNLFIGLYDHATDTITFPFMKDEKDRFEKVPAGKTISSLVIKENKSLLITEKQIMQLAREGKIKIVGTISKCWMGVPLRVDGEVMGVMVVQDYENETALSTSDLELLEFVSNQVAISIKKKQTDDEIRKLSLAIEQSPASVVITNLEGTIEYVNQKFTEVTGYSKEEAIGKKPSILKSGETPEEDYRELWRTIAAGKEWRGEFCNRRKDGSLFWEFASIRPIKNASGEITHYLGVKEDITERKKLQQQLIQSQKMEAIGKLAGGVAHDFNNLLTVINGYADLLLYKLSSDDPPYKAIRQIKLAGERAASLTEQLLAFSRRQLIQPKILNLNNVVSHTEKMLRRLIGEDIDLVTKLDPELGNIKADPSQIDQVIMNLAVNARDAMPQGGKLTIETANVNLDDVYVKAHEQVLPGEYVMLAISDSGKGMDEETRSRIFEPFFTTKGPGEGTGLGLSTVYGIIKQNRGYIWVYSEPGKGTTFKIYLPRVSEESREPKTITDAGETLRGHETILLVEDDENVRELSSRILKENGYLVLEADRGSSAINISNQYEDTIHLLLTDVIMPEMSGRELAEHLTHLRPEMKIIYVSGYTDNAIVHHGVLDKNTHFIQKPFAPKTLLEKIRNVLDEQ